MLVCLCEGWDRGKETEKPRDRKKRMSYHWMRKRKKNKEKETEEKEKGKEKILALFPLWRHLYLIMPEDSPSKPKDCL